MATKLSKTGCFKGVINPEFIKGIQKIYDNLSLGQDNISVKENRELIQQAVLTYRETVIEEMEQLGLDTTDVPEAPSIESKQKKSKKSERSKITTSAPRTQRKQGTLRNLFTDIKRAGGIKTRTFKLFTDPNETNRQIYSTIKKNTSPFGMDQMAGMMQDRGWIIPNDVDGNVDVNAFVAMLVDYANGNPPVHPDNTDAVSEMQEAGILAELEEQLAASEQEFYTESSEYLSEIAGEATGDIGEDWFAMFADGQEYIEEVEGADEKADGTTGSNAGGVDARGQEESNQGAGSGKDIGKAREAGSAVPYGEASPATLKAARDVIKKLGRSADRATAFDRYESLRKQNAQSLTEASFLRVFDEEHAKLGGKGVKVLDMEVESAAANEEAGQGDMFGGGTVKQLKGDTKDQGNEAAESLMGAKQNGVVDATGAETLSGDAIRNSNMPEPNMATVEKLLADAVDSGSNSVILKPAQMSSLGNLLYMATNKQGQAPDDNRFGSIVRVVSGSKYGERVFSVARPYGVLTINTANNTVSVERNASIKNDAKAAALYLSNSDDATILDSMMKDTVNNRPEQTLVNELMQNAIDATATNKDDRRITIAHSREYGDDGIAKTVLTVKDNGSGMSEHDVLTKFLGIGEKGKNSKNSLGGYARAKTAFLLMPASFTLTTTKAGITTILTATREQLKASFLNPSENPLQHKTRPAFTNERGTTLELSSYAYADDAKAANTFAVNLYDLQEFIPAYIDKVMIDGLTIAYTKEGHGVVGPDVTVTQSVSKRPHEYKPVKGRVGENTFTVHFVTDTKPKKKDWKGDYLTEISVLNKGLWLDQIKSNNFNLQGMLKEPKFSVFVDFGRTADVNSVDYPFIQNRTQMNYEVAEAISAIVNAKIDAINQDQYAQDRDAFNAMLEDSPIVSGVRVLIPFTDKTEIAETKKIINANAGLFADLADIYNGFQRILYNIGEAPIELSVTMDMSVHGYRAKTRIVQHAIYALNPFSLTKQLLEVDAYNRSIEGGSDANLLRASNLVHTLVHEYNHNQVGPHNEDFTIALSVLYGRISHIALAQLEEQAYDFFTKHQPAISSIAEDIGRYGKEGSRFQADNSNAKPPEKLQSESEGQTGVPAVSGRNRQTTVAQFSHATANVGAGVSIDNLQSAVATMQRMFPGINIVVHDSPADVSWATPTARGAYYNGEVHLFRSNIKNSAQAVLTVLAHEFTHNGIDRLGEKGQQLLKQIALAHVDEVKKIMGIRGWEDTPENRVRAAGELVAQHGETKLKQSWWNKVMEFVRDVVTTISGNPVKSGLLESAIREIRAQMIDTKSKGYTIKADLLDKGSGERNAKGTARIFELIRMGERGRTSGDGGSIETAAAYVREIHAELQQRGPKNAGRSWSKKPESIKLKKWAEENGLLRDPHEFYKKFVAQFTKTRLALEGGEHAVVLSDDRKTVAKRNNMPDNYHHDYAEYFDRLQLWNYFAKSFGTDYKLTGFSLASGLTLPELEQTAVDGVAAKSYDVEAALGRNYAPIKHRGSILAYQVPGTDIIITDFYNDNTKHLVDANGNRQYHEDGSPKLMPIDYVILHGDRAREWVRNAMAERDKLVGEVTEQEAENAVQIPMAAFSRTEDDVSRIGSAKELLVRAAKSVNNARHQIFDTASVIGREFMGSRYRTKGLIERAYEDAKALHDQILKFRKDTKTTEQMFAFLTTKDANPASIENKEARELAQQAKQLIMAMGRRLVAKGLMAEETLETHEGEYLPRLYSRHLLGNDLFHSITAGGKKMDLSYLKKRRNDIPEEVRHLLLGEIKDPAYLVYMALARPARDLALHAWLGEIAAVREWTMPKMLVDWNLNEKPSYRIGGITYTINEDGSYDITIQHNERVWDLHQNVDADFIAKNMGYNFAKHVKKTAQDGEWRSYGSAQWRKHGEGFYDIKLQRRQTTEEHYEGVDAKALDAIVGGVRAEWMRTGIITSKRGDRPVSTVGGRQVTPFWLAEEAKLLRMMADDSKSLLPKETLRHADRMEALARKTLSDAGYEFDQNMELKSGSLPDGWRQIPNTPKYGPLRGLVVRAPIYTDIVGNTGGKGKRSKHAGAYWSDAAEGLLGDNGLLWVAHRVWKATKTTYNPGTHVANFVSNALLVHLNTRIGVHEFPRYLVKAFQAVTDHNNDYYRIGKLYGFTAASFSNAEIGRINTELLHYLAHAEGKTHPLRQVQHLLGIVSNAAGDSYQLNEQLFKTMVLIYNIEAQNMSSEEAALEAHEALFDYSDVSATVRFLREHYMGSPFLTFTYKMTAQMVRKFIKETSASKQALTSPGTWSDKGFALYRATNYTRKLATWNTILYMLPGMVASSIGIGDDDWEKIKKSAEAFVRAKSHGLLLPMVEDGEITIIDVSRFMPWDIAIQIGKSVLGTVGLIDDYQPLTKTLGIMSGPVPQLIAAINTGRDPFTKRELWPAEDMLSTAEKTGRLMMYLYNMTVPSFMSQYGSAKKVYDWANNHVHPKTGKPVTWGEAVAPMLGAGVYNYKPEQTRKQQIDRMEHELVGMEIKRKAAKEDDNFKHNPEGKTKVMLEWAEKIQRKKAEIRKFKEQTRFNRLTNRREVTFREVGDERRN